MIMVYWPSLANHLWQSTVFAFLAGLMTLAFRNNGAPVRYGLWLSASVKFLIPFSLMVAIGSHLGPAGTAPDRRSSLSSIVKEVGQPFAPLPPAVPAAIVQQAPNPVPNVLFGVWFCGFAAGVLSWVVRWRRIRAAVHQASPLQVELPIRNLPVMSCRARMEPGVFGVLRPVLLLPEGITARLSPAQLEAILAHEACHVRRRDNLAAAIHMVVEALFWFHPLVWWIRERLVEERERACDEEVLTAGRDPEDYAEGILNVCKFYVASPLVSVSGVTGSNLTRRIEAIMTHRATDHLNFGRKLLLAAAAAAVLATPITIGIVNAPPLRAQSQPERRLAFEVASVKLNKSTGFPNLGFKSRPGGRLSLTNVPLYLIIAGAYGVSFQSPRLSGGPDWTREERYDIEAAPEKGAVPLDLPPREQDSRMRLMLQSLLADRFKLKIRHEAKEIPVYAVVVGRNGPKLQKSKTDEKDCSDESGKPATPCHAFQGGQGRGLHGQAVDIADLAAFVENWSDRPVIDKTGIQGLFDITSEGWSPLIPRHGPPGSTGGEENLSDPSRPTLFTIFEMLGLKLEPQKAPVDIFIIDHVERPTGN